MNSHGFPPRILNPVRLPIPSLRQKGLLLIFAAIAFQYQKLVSAEHQNFTTAIKKAIRSNAYRPLSSYAH